MTINNSQGQTLSNVGLYLRRSVFTHGQLYVAMSRVRNRSGLKVLICHSDGRDPNRTSNAVYKEEVHSLLERFWVAERERQGEEEGIQAEQSGKIKSELMILHLAFLFVLRLCILVLDNFYLGKQWEFWFAIKRRSLRTLTLVHFKLIRSTTAAKMMILSFSLAIMVERTFQSRREPFEECRRGKHERT
ncbi:ATP-dependent DNA helicase PIF1-like [Senna tora]|uniref:ATP-dependent DNA helicase PIF1-like n=1 Tax=Senna tora TaxID=362788 RepID=A0A834T1F2_9FABA|nr:ATP-dependent DNA helicase PIF1-like [Senna tora]